MSNMTIYSPDTQTAYDDVPVSPSADIRNPEYQALKGRIHEELLGRLNLERLARVKREDAEPEIRHLISDLLDRESHRIPLSLFERDAIIVDVLH